MALSRLFHICDAESAPPSTRDAFLMKLHPRNTASAP